MFHESRGPTELSANNRDNVEARQERERGKEREREREREGERERERKEAPGFPGSKETQHSISRSPAVVIFAGNNFSRGRTREKRKKRKEKKKKKEKEKGKKKERKKTEKCQKAG